MKRLASSIAILLVGTAAVMCQAVGAGRNGQNGGSYTLTGKVILADGKPAVGANVDAVCEFSSPRGSTDMDGTFRLTGVPSGDCKVTVTYPGYLAATETRRIEDDTPYGQAIYMPFFLRIDPYGEGNPIFAGISREAIDKLRQAMDKESKNKTDDALRLLDQAIAADAKFAAAYYEKGNLLLKKNDLDGAIPLFVKAIELKPDYVEAKYGFGLAQFQKKNYEVSEQVFRDVLKQRTSMSEAHLNLGISLFYLKNVNDAETELKAAATAPDGERFALAHLFLGQIYMQRKANAAAIEELQKYLQLVPKAPNADRVKSAIEDLKKKS